MLFSAKCVLTRFGLFSDSLRMVCAMIDQVMQLHPGVKHFHIGCDEASTSAFQLQTHRHIAHSSYISFQPVLHDRCNKGCDMCYPVCGMVHIKEPLLLIGKSSPCGSSGFPLSQSEWSFTICLTPYNRKKK